MKSSDYEKNALNARLEYHRMIHIRRIEPQEVPFAKELIYRVAHQVFQDTRPLEESFAFYESRGTLKDMDDVGIQLEFAGPVTVQAAVANMPAANDAEVVN